MVITWWIVAFCEILISYAYIYHDFPDDVITYFSIKVFDKYW